MNYRCILPLFLVLTQLVVALLPPKFQWNIIDYKWTQYEREKAIGDGTFIPENNMPTGIARWQDKLFITIPRWKKGVPSSLNFIYVNGSQNQPLNPYPNWLEAYLPEMLSKGSTLSNSTVVSTFRVHVENNCHRLWVVDNGAIDMASEVTQISEPAILAFDLITDTLAFRYVLPDHVLEDSSAFTSLVVDSPSDRCSCKEARVYIADMGSNAIVVFTLANNEAWRVENRHFASDPSSGIFHVGGIDFFWSDGVSSLALSEVDSSDYDTRNYRDLYFHPTASTKVFKMSTKLLRTKYVDPDKLNPGVELVGDRGPNSQATALAFDLKSEILFFTQLNKNGLGCWRADKPLTPENAPVILSDCSLLEFPNDVIVDHDRNLWIISDRQSRFLYNTMNFNEVNFRILTAPIDQLVKGTPCEKKWTFSLFGERKNTQKNMKDEKTW